MLVQVCRRMGTSRAELRQGSDYSAAYLDERTGRLMGWSNPAVPWKELERRLSGRPPTDPHGDAPISRRRRLQEQEIEGPEGPVVPYAELHAHSDFSFLDGASAPAKLVEEAIRQGLYALAITDHDGFYGAP